MEDSQESMAVQCANPDCKIGTGGRCLEGFPDATACPNYGKALVIVASTDPTHIKAAPTGVRLPHAESLSLNEATLMVRHGPSSVISLVGPHDSGKTSLIAGMYDLLQLGTVGRYAFAGSSTMHAFERACHDSRRESQRDVAHMERTERGQILFFHLDLVDADSAEKRAALLGNRAGEEYMFVQNEPDLANGYPELKRADVLTILVDGAKLLDAGERHQVRAQVRLTLRAFVEVGVAPVSQRLAVVLTKLDAVRKSQAEGGALSFFEGIVGQPAHGFCRSFHGRPGVLRGSLPKDNRRRPRRGDGCATGILDGGTTSYCSECRGTNQSER
ncbi:MAG: hypothetical protein IPO35_15100 [Uliginosibacterium sp.]|nr:hypothetical protein [Uliginosibacterium sp.]